MSYKTILVHVAPDAGDAPRIKVAAQLARKFDAELMGLCAERFEPNTDRRLTHLDGLQLRPVRERLEAAVKRAEVQFIEVAGGCRSLWRTSFSDPDDQLIDHANRADLIVASRAAGRTELRQFAEPDDLILESGLPVLLLPPDQDAIDGRRVVIGWKNTPQTRRAVTAAMPFLVRAEAVDIVAVGSADEQSHIEAQLSDVADRLRSHGARPETVFLAAGLASDAERLLQHATARKAGLIVVGGFGHTRQRQWVLGGVTSYLLAHAWKPVMFVH